MIWTEDRRVGRFSIALDLVKEEPKTIADAFADLSVVPIVAEPDIFSDGISYRAWSPSFDVVAEHQVVPWYDLIITTTDDGTVQFFVKRKPRG